MKNYLNYLILVIYCVIVNGYPDNGKWHIQLDLKHHIVVVPKSLFKGSQVFVQVVCSSKPPANLYFSWSLTELLCWEDLIKTNDKEVPPKFFLQLHDNKTISSYVGPKEFECSGPVEIPKMVIQGGKDPPLSDTNALAPTDVHISISDDTKTVKTKTHPKEGEHHPAVTITEDGFYVLTLMIDGTTDFTASVEIEMLGEHGYLSAADWPLLPFYGIMCLVYILLGIIWLIASFCRWQDLLRIQFWIGGVIFLGMLEKAMFYGEYSSVNKTGESVKGAVLAAEWVSCAKRTLARMLVIIVNLGFGIVKPRLGPMLHRVVGVGACYFVLACIESYIRVMPPSSDTSNKLLIASIPLAALDSIICWWILTALVQTTRALRLRRNTVKLNLYRHFTNTLIFNVLASIIFMLYTIKTHRLSTCITDWKELWVDDAFWHILFSIILVVIMILWRPNNNNQRYAFSPLLDNPDDDEDEEHFVNDAYVGVKMRTHSRASSPKQRPSNDDEDILKWVDDNIPSAGVEAALPILDSDEEVLTTRFEISKML